MILYSRNFCQLYEDKATYKITSLTLVTRLVSLNICWYPFVRIYIYLFEISPSPSVKCEWDETV